MLHSPFFFFLFSRARFLYTLTANLPPIPTPTPSLLPCCPALHTHKNPSPRPTSPRRAAVPSTVTSSKPLVPARPPADTPPSPPQALAPASCGYPALIAPTASKTPEKGTQEEEGGRSESLKRKKKQSTDGPLRSCPAISQRRVSSRRPALLCATTPESSDDHSPPGSFVSSRDPSDAITMADAVQDHPAKVVAEAHGVDTFRKPTHRDELQWMAGGANPTRELNMTDFRI